MEYDPEDYDPKFDLLIGTKTMKELDIVLDYGQNMTMIDQIGFPMRSLKGFIKTQLCIPDVQKYWTTQYNGSNKKAIWILDAKYEKQIYQK